MRIIVSTSSCGGQRAAPVSQHHRWHQVKEAETLTFPIARRALSKNRIIPKKRKNTPKPVNPIPISAGHTHTTEWLNDSTES